jgi:hypothetical protein
MEHGRIAFLRLDRTCQQRRRYKGGCRLEVGDSKQSLNGDRVRPKDRFVVFAAARLSAGRY